jgi:hypothetical protein
MRGFRWAGVDFTCTVAGKGSGPVSYWTGPLVIGWHIYIMVLIVEKILPRLRAAPPLYSKILGCSTVYMFLIIGGSDR